MKKKLIFVVILVLICSVFCGILSSCGKKPEESNVATAKPDIQTALGNYEKVSVKKSDFSMELTATLHRNVKDPNGKLVPSNFFVKEKLSLVRILNNDKIYVEGSLKTDSITEDLPTTYKSAQRLIRKDYDSEKDSILRYLEGKTYFDAKLGYADGSYNLKLATMDDGKAKRNFWGATDNASVNDLIKSFKVDATVDMSKYVMSTGIIDLTEVSDWLSGDAASKYLSPQTKKFIYNITADPEKLNETLFKYIEKFAALFGKEDYAEDLELYAKLLPYIKQWVSFGPSSIDASVSDKGLPEEMTTSMQLNLNINKVQLEEVIGILFENPKDKEKIIGTMNLLFMLLSPTDTDNNASGTLGLTFDFKVKEKFSYDKAACSLEKVDGDLFIPATEDAENRREYLYKYEEEKQEQE